MKKKNIKKALKLSSFALCLSCLQSAEVLADSFLTPAQNTISLKNVFNRPYLQKKPVPDVWEVTPETEAFKKAYYNKETKEGRHFDVLTHSLDSLDLEHDVSVIEVDDEKYNSLAISDAMQDVFPLGTAQSEEISKTLELDDAKFLKASVDLEEKELSILSEEMSSLQFYLGTLEELAKINIELEVLLPFLEKKEAEIDKMFEKERKSVSIDDSLSAMEETLVSETEYMQGIRSIEELFLVLTINDLVDLSTGIDILAQDELPLTGEITKRTSLSASLLDTGQKNKQILERDLSEKKKAIFDMMQKYTVEKKAKNSQQLGIKNEE